MKNIWQSLVFALALAATAHAQVPSTNDKTDPNLLNTGGGSGAINPATTGTNNTAYGYEALTSNTSGFSNTAAGFDALQDNTSGSSNTAAGYEALFSNSGGIANTATGAFALYDNTTGNDNTASGVNSLRTNTTGISNTASGVGALYSNTIGNYNIAVGAEALFSNTSGVNQTAAGYQALFSNTTGDFNTAFGYQALRLNTSGGGNTAVGDEALSRNSTGSGNTALGYNAGALITDSNNIDIGNEGVATDSGVIRIGTRSTHRQAFIVGIYTTSMIANSLPVYVDSAGRLSAGTSSERFKTAIVSMGSNTAKLGLLRPVTFKLKSDATSTRQYGLIAEEVAKVYPELVIRNSAGRIDGVRYDELAPMLLNETQQQQLRIAEQAAEIRELKQQQKQFATRSEVNYLKQQLQAALLQLHAADELVARR
jgi:Chaperone of endosialidase